MHEDQVDVGCIVQFLAPQLAQGKHGEGRRVQPALLGADLQGHTNADIRKVADSAGGLRHRGKAEQVAQADPQHFRRFEAAQRIPLCIGRFRDTNPSR